MAANERLIQAVSFHFFLHKNGNYSFVFVLLFVLVAPDGEEDDGGMGNCNWAIM